jgi:hypothetical protein
MKKRPTQFDTGLDAGLLIAATHLDYLGEETLRDEVLKLNHLTLADLERSKTA